MKFVEVEDNIYRIKNILDTKDFFSLNDELDSKYNTWRFTKNDSYEEDHPNMGCLMKPLSKFNTIGDNLTLIKYGTLLKYQCQKIIKQTLTLNRVNTNIQFFGQESTFHTDGSFGSWTLLIFANSSWNSSWGGEFVVMTEDKEYLYQSFIPNDAVLFPAHLEHMGFAPNVLCKHPRMTIAYTYT